MESILAAKETLIQLNSWLKCIKKDVYPSKTYNSKK